MPLTSPPEERPRFRPQERPGDATLDQVPHFFRPGDEFDRRFPANPPNSAAKHGLVCGIRPTFVAQETAYWPLLTFGVEKIFAWSVEVGKRPGRLDEVEHFLVSEVAPEARNSLALVNFSRALALSESYVAWFESLFDLRAQYNWIYEFAPERSFSEQCFLYGDHALFGTRDASILSAARFLDLLPCMALLENDSKARLALGHLRASFRSFQTCLRCAVTGSRMHEHFEPQPWDYPELLADLENASVQAVMAIETLVGKPGKRSRSAGDQRMRDRWTAVLKVRPDDEFLDSGESLLDEYYRAFAVRNDSAHAWRDLQPAMRLESSLRCQVLAFRLCSDYVDNRVPDPPAAALALGLTRTAEDLCVPAKRQTGRPG